MLDVSVAKVCCRSEETVMHDLIVVIAAREERTNAMYVRVVLIPNLLRFFFAFAFTHIQCRWYSRIFIWYLLVPASLFASNKKGAVWPLED
jgi:hypothetical protein